MSPGPDLFVVCNQCGSEVSPYITECPYCGSRLRSRAPKLPRVKSRGRLLRRLGRSLTFNHSPSRPRARLGRSSQRADRGDYPRGESPPYATIALVALGCVGWVLVRGGLLGAVHVAGLGYVSGAYVSFFKIAIGGPLHGDWWKLLSNPFAYVNGLYAFIALLATAIFGWLLERRRGAAIVLVVFFAGSVTGALAAVALYADPIVSGANAGALALIAAWSIPDLRALRGGRYYEGDLLGAGAIAALLLVLPYARPEANWVAGVVGALFGLIAGLGLDLTDSGES
ncbi:MAG TPA: rhomboid family intramembrane serine protease [Solirubrobacteraceae bacterium]|jgi:membrane associated rhomboid family serine protease